MADEAITGCEQCGVGVRDPDVHDQWHRGEVGPASSPAATSSPPSWWQQWAAAHDLKRAHQRGQRNLL